MDPLGDRGMTGSEQTSGYCFDCGHELVDTGTHTCPECGRWFDPLDSRTCFRRRPGLLARLMMKPAGWLSALFGLTLALFILFAFSVPGGYFALAILALMALFIVIIGLVADLLISVFVSWKMGRSWLFEVRPGSKSRAVRWSQLKWLIAPALLIVAEVLAVFGVPVRFAFWVSQSDLLALIEGRSTQTIPGYVGLLPVASIDGDTVWLSEGGGLLDQAGFAYLPHIQSDVIEPSDGVRGWRYSGNWFLVESEF